MGKRYTFTTEEERQKIKTLLDLGADEKQVMQITGRSYNIVHAIATGTYETMKEADRVRQSKGRKAERAKQQKEIAEALDTALEEKKRQETRERIQEEAIKAGAPSFEDDGIPVEAKILPASPFSYDTLLRRVADGIDYNNALMNGVLNKLDMLCKALGVGE